MRDAGAACRWPAHTASFCRGPIDLSERASQSDSTMRTRSAGFTLTVYGHRLGADLVYIAAPRWDIYWTYVGRSAGRFHQLPRASL